MQFMDDVEEVAALPQAGMPISDKLTPLLVSLFISVLAVNLLYTYSDQQILWIALFAVLLLILLGVKRIIKTKYFRKEELEDVDARTLLGFFSLTQILVVIITKLVVDLASLIAAINVMQWHAYVNTAALIICFAFAILGQIQISV